VARRLGHTKSGNPSAIQKSSDLVASNGPRRTILIIGKDSSRTIAEYCRSPGRTKVKSTSVLWSRSGSGHSTHRRSIPSSGMKTNDPYRRTVIGTRGRPSARRLSGSDRPSLSDKHNGPSRRRGEIGRMCTPTISYLLTTEPYVQHGFRQCLPCQRNSSNWEDRNRQITVEVARSKESGGPCGPTGNR